MDVEETRNLGRGRPRWSVGSFEPLPNLVVLFGRGVLEELGAELDGFGDEAGGADEAGVDEGVDDGACGCKELVDDGAGEDIVTEAGCDELGEEAGTDGNDDKDEMLRAIRQSTRLSVLHPSMLITPDNHASCSQLNSTLRMQTFRMTSTVSSFRSHSPAGLLNNIDCHVSVCRHN